VGLLSNVEGYHAALTAYRAGDISPIVLSFANAALNAIGNSRQLIAEIDVITEGWRNRIKARRDSNVWALLDLVARRPVMDAATAAAELGVMVPNVYPPLRTLTEQGVLKSKTRQNVKPVGQSYAH